MPEPEISIERFEIFATGVDHAECIAFDRDGNLWAGGEGGQIYRIDTSGKVHIVAMLDGFVGGIAFSPRDQCLYACNPTSGIVRVQPDGRHEVFANAAGEHRMCCPNYPLFDRQGRLYLTDSGHWKKQNGFVLRFEPDGQGEIIGGPFGYANGLALTADERSLFMAESDTDRVYRFTLDPGGMLNWQEIYAEPVGRLPDGLSLDTAGNLYVACYASDELWRITDSREKKLFAWHHHAILLSRPTNLAWGGADYHQLYVANFGRTTISRVQLTGTRGQALAHQIE